MSGQDPHREGEHPCLVWPIAEARKELEDRCDRGIDIRFPEAVVSQYSFTDTLTEPKQWHTYNVRLLKRMFSDDTIAREYTSTGSRRLSESEPERMMRLTMERITFLEGLIQQLPLFPQVEQGDEEHGTGGGCQAAGSPGAGDGGTSSTRGRPGPTPPTAALSVTEEEAKAELHRAIREGERLLGDDDGWLQNTRSEDLNGTRQGEASVHWMQITERRFTRVFKGTEVLTWYRARCHAALTRVRKDGLPFSEWIQDCVTDLHRIHDIIQFCEPQDGVSVPRQPEYDRRRVFIVHGHDDAAKHEVARFIEKGDLKAVILAERPGGGTWLDKLRANSDVGFAVVLFTPDDVGAAAHQRQDDGSYPLKPRARQNVVFELGYFIARLPEGHVRVLLKGDAERPTDYPDVYTEMDPAGGWKTKLARELDHAGLDFNWQKALGKSRSD